MGSYCFLMSPKEAALVMAALGKAEQVETDYSLEIGYYVRPATRHFAPEMKLIADAAVMTAKKRTAKPAIPQKASEDCPHFVRIEKKKAA
jgi:hypothetical protein